MSLGGGRGVNLGKSRSVSQPGEIRDRSMR